MKFWFWPQYQPAKRVVEIPEPRTTVIVSDVQPDANTDFTYLIVHLSDRALEDVRRIVREEISNMSQNEQHHGREKHDASD